MRFEKYLLHIGAAIVVLGLLEMLFTCMGAM